MLDSLDLANIWQDVGSDHEQIGLWMEHFTAPIERLETNYARLDHRHDLAAYWGAGRDRIPASPHDQFETPKDICTPFDKLRGFGERLTGTNYDNICHST